MENIYYLLLIGLICWYFVYVRQVSESARFHVNQYCKKTQLQFIAIARRSTRLNFTKQHGLAFYSIFDFEFSGNGEEKNDGIVTLYGLKLNTVDVPVYRVH